MVEIPFCGFVPESEYCSIFFTDSMTGLVLVCLLYVVSLHQRTGMLVAVSMTIVVLAWCLHSTAIAGLAGIITTTTTIIILMIPYQKK